ncbi:MAG: fructosamine kinase family protein [Bacteroidales bacterium]|nr:fructosamine kinase family protein [Bacteroidales bacterium]
MLSKEIIKGCEEVLSRHFGSRIAVNNTSSVGGGCINDAHRIETGAGTFFMKYNSAHRYPGMFEAEARGLRLLAGAGCLRVPEVIGYDTAGDDALLILEHIAAAPRAEDFWINFGVGLAKMHKPGTRHGGDEQAAPSFGLDHDNYIGSLPQSNRQHESWTDFFMAERLEAQLKRARDTGKAGADLVSMFDALSRHLGDFFPEEPPALLHGDLWSGNYMCGDDGQAVVIDPAVYYGHRYMDLGMSKLFGGFSAAFYDAYAQTFPLEASWQKSLDIANLYPLMVHVNLFGGSYPGSVKAILRKFV